MKFLSSQTGKARKAKAAKEHNRQQCGNSKKPALITKKQVRLKYVVACIEDVGQPRFLFSPKSASCVLASRRSMVFGLEWRS